MSKFWHTEEKGEIQDDRIVSTFQQLKQNKIYILKFVNSLFQLVI